MNKANNWFGPIAGLLFVAAVVVGGGVFGGVDAEPSDAASTVVNVFRENAGEIQTAAFLITVGLGFLLVFLGHLRNRLRENGGGWAADGLLAGGIAVVGGWLVLTGFQLGGGVAGDSGHAEAAQTAVDFLWEGTFLFTPGLLAFGIAAIAAGFLSSAIPTWLGGLAVLVGLGALAPWIGIFVFVLWVLLASIVELTRAVRPAVPADVR